MTDYTKLEAYGPLRLRSGAGGDYKNGLCVMETVAWLASEDATDKPECACPALGEFAIKLNDGLDNINRQKLLPLALPLTGTRSTEHEQRRAEYITLRVIREILPEVFDEIGMPEHASALRNAQDLETARAARAAARAARAAAYAAARAADADARAAARAARAAADAAADAAARAADAAAYAAARAADAAADAAAYAAARAADAAAYAAADADKRQALLLKCIPILEDAIMLGPNAADQWPELRPRAEDLGRFAETHLARADD